MADARDRKEHLTASDGGYFVIDEVDAAHTDTSDTDTAADADTIESADAADKQAADDAAASDEAVLEKAADGDKAPADGADDRESEEGAVAAEDADADDADSADASGGADDTAAAGGDSADAAAPQNSDFEDCGDRAEADKDEDDESELFEHDVVCGEDDAAESTLDCKITELETVDLDVRHTYYTPEGFNSATAKTQDQLNTVYFAVPKRLEDMYGKLSRVQAEWYEYKTKPVFVMGDDTVYDHLKGYVGYVTDGTYNEDIKYGLVSNFHWSGPHDAYPMGDYIYNAMGMAHTETIAELDEIQYLFKADTDSAGNTVITAEELLDYIRDRSTYESDLILGKYASCLFTDDVGEGRKSGSEGKTEVNIWADETFDLTSTVITQNFWEWLLGMSTAVTTTYNGIKAIYEVTEEDIEYSPAETCKNLYINDDDYEEFKAFYDDAVTVDPSDPEDEERIVYLFRFSVTDTYSAQVTYFEQDPLHARENNAYMSMQNVFLDFDIISLTYERNGVYTVIPVVADPIDIFADVTPPPDFEEEEDGLAWWQILLIVLGVVLAVYLVYKLIKWISGNNTTVTVKYKYNKRKRKRR